MKYTYVLMALDILAKAVVKFSELWSIVTFITPTLEHDAVPKKK